jgi:hypothetical protein
MEWAALWIAFCNYFNKPAMPGYPHDQAAQLTIERVAKFCERPVQSSCFKREFEWTYDFFHV